MSKSSKLCPSCKQENLGDAEFCTNCGSSFSTNDSELMNNSDTDVTDNEDEEDSYKNWIMSLPYMIATCIFLLFIDIITGGGIDWSYWAVVPIILFGIIAPYFSYKLGDKLE